MHFYKGNQPFLKGTCHFGCDVMHRKDVAIIFILVQAHLFSYSVYILQFVSVLPLPTCSSTAQIVSKKGYVPLAQVKYAM